MHSLEKYDASVRARGAIEQRIVRTLVKELLSFGFWLGVYDGEEIHPPTREAHKLHKALIETDEDFLLVLQPDTTCRCGETVPASVVVASETTPQYECPICHECLTYGYVRLVYGNDGWDVICDTTTNLERYMKKTDALVEKLS